MHKAPLSPPKGEEMEEIFAETEATSAYTQNNY